MNLSCQPHTPAPGSAVLDQGDQLVNPARGLPRPEGFGITELKSGWSGAGCILALKLSTQPGGIKDTEEA